MHWTVHTAHYTLHSVHCTLDTPQCKLYTAYCKLCTPHSTIQTVHCTLHSAHWTLHTAHCTMHNLKCSLPTTHCTVHNAKCTLPTTHCKLHNRAIKFATKHTDMFSTICYCVTLVLLIPKQFLFSFLFPPIVKNQKKYGLLILIAQKKSFIALNATQKPSFLCYVPFLKNQEKTPKMQILEHTCIFGSHSIFLRAYFHKVLNWKQKQFWDQKGKPHTMTHSRDHLSVFGSKLTSPTSQCSMHTAHYPVHTAHYPVHTAHYPVHTAHCTLHTEHFTLHTAKCTLHAAHYTPVWALFTLSMGTSLAMPRFTFRISLTWRS